MPEQPTQREYWSGKAGDEWAANAARIDAMLAPIAEALINAGAFQAGEHVLDIGCGSGATSIAIAQRVGASGGVVGVDLSPQLLSVARARSHEAGVNAVFVEADAGAASFDRSFDAAFSRFGVMFFEAPAKAFAHIRAAMKPDGRLVFVCWRPMLENIWATAPIEAITPLLKAPLTPPDPNAPGPYAFADRSKVEGVLGEAGWQHINVAPWSGEISAGGNGTLDEIADFMLRIGPCARVAAEQNLDYGEVHRRLVARLSPHYSNGAVTLSAGCWLVTARA